MQHLFEVVYLQIICSQSLLPFDSYLRCDHVLESDLLKHLQIYGRRYQKIDLRGCNKLTGTVLFRECEKRALSEGIIKSEAIFDCKKILHRI